MSATAAILIELLQYILLSPHGTVTHRSIKGEQYRRNRNSLHPRGRAGALQGRAGAARVRLPHAAENLVGRAAGCNGVVVPAAGVLPAFQSGRGPLRGDSA